MPHRAPTHRPALLRLKATLFIGILFAGSGCAAPTPEPPSTSPKTSLGTEGPTVTPEKLKRKLDTKNTPDDSDGVIPTEGGVSAIGSNLPAITGLEPGLLSAIQAATTAASADDVVLRITSGWRSKQYQQTLFDEAVHLYASEEEARKWVATPDQSSHVSGRAVDVGPVDAMSWMSQHGNLYGLCQTYANEPWHYELTVEPGAVCPAARIDAGTP